jgi:hypothetical protein
MLLLAKRKELHVEQHSLRSTMHTIVALLQRMPFSVVIALNDTWLP